MLNNGLNFYANESHSFAKRHDASHETKRSLQCAFTFMQAPYDMTANLSTRCHSSCLID